MIEILSLIGLLIPLITSILKEFFSSRARAREENKKFELNKKIFLEFLDRSLADMRKEVAEMNQRSGDLQDTIDREIN